MLHIHVSNQHERLLDALLARLSNAAGDPFLADQIIVPGAAHRRAITLALTDRQGVCANLDFRFLAQWLWQQAAVISPVGDKSPLDPNTLAWRVYQALHDTDLVRRHPRLSGYLDSAAGDHVMAFDLAVRVASLMEQYATFRPEWLMQWRTGALYGSLGPDEAWQAALWKRIAEQIGLTGSHPLQIFMDRLNKEGDDLAKATGVPRDVHVFGLASIPPLYLSALKALAVAVDVHLYVLNPCREYWHDLVAPAQLGRLEAQGAEGFEVGHPLLASWGGQTQSHLALLLDQAEGPSAQTHEDFVEPGMTCLLHRLQHSILELEDIEACSIAVTPGDRSLEVHVCHSMTRQLEVLQDYLLGLFADDPQLRLSDIAVVMPDMESAAPLIDAVFGSAPMDRRIPFEITGLGRSRANRCAQAFSSLLGLATSRAPATELHGVLQLEVVARRFGLDDTGLQQIHEWLLVSGVHWALDTDHVLQEKLPAARHTAAAGLERLFLAYALPDRSQDCMHGFLPAGHAEGSGALPLGALHDFVEGLRKLRVDLSPPRPIASWSTLLHAAADTFLDPPPEEIEDLSDLHAAIDELTAHVEGAGLLDPLPFSVVQTALGSLLEDTARGGVPSGRVTFTGMSTLRGIPFKVICALGLEDGAFPRPNRPTEFDLMAAQPRLGDRQRRLDQRNIFLDLLLAARSRFYMSYSGRSIRDNAAMPPSVLVSELLDVLIPAIARSQSDQDLANARGQLVVQHPLQPFSPVYFTRSPEQDPRLESFDQELASALRAGAASETAWGAQANDGSDDEESAAETETPFFTQPLGPPDAEWRDVRLDQLTAFYRGPSRYLLGRRMGIELTWTEADLADEEPFAADLPARSALAQRLLPALIAGETADRLFDAARAGTEFPEGVMGRYALEEELAQLERFAVTLRGYASEAALAPYETKLTMNLEDEAWTLRGGFADLRPSGRMRSRYDDERAGDVVCAWIEHLFLCASTPQGVAASTLHVARDGIREFSALQPSDALGHLTRLLQGYRQGLREPLPFFPKSAWAMVTQGEASARAAWKGRDFPGERTKDGNDLTFRGVADPLGVGFQDWAEDVFKAAHGCSTHRLPGARP